MVADVKAWREIVLGVVAAIADEELQRRAWFGIGPEQSSPDETVTQFFDNARFAEFLVHPDNGLSDKQALAGRELYALMDRFASSTPDHLNPVEVIDDPRWREIREVAAVFMG